MEGKIKVKDLAAEMDVSPKDLLRRLTDMGLEAKNSASSISMDEAARVKAQYHPDETSEVMRKEIEPGLIIRRRRARTDDAPAESESAPEAETASKSEPVPPKAAEPDKPSPVAEPVADSEDGDTDEAPAQKKRKARKVVETPPARIIRPVAEPKPEPAPALQPEAKMPVADEVQAAPAAPVEALPKEEEAARPKPKVAPAASAEPEGSSAPSLLPPVSENRAEGASDSRDEITDRGKRRRIQDSPPQPQVRVISRPDPSAARVVTPAAPARDSRDGRDDRRPQGQQQRPPRPGGAPGSPRPASAGGPSPFAPAQPPVEGADQSRKKRNKGRRTVDFPQDNDAFGKHKSGDEDSGSRFRGRGRKPKKQMVVPQSTQPMKAAKRKIRMEEAIRVADLAHQMSVKSGDVIKVLFNLGVMATINNAIDIDTATLVASEFGYEVEKTGFSEDEFLVPTQADSAEQLKPRPPVVTIMGHVDHGKTSLLDAIRQTSVTSGEAGGITQHIGAYHVTTKRGDIVFLDTPGHEAFTAMRARGAQMTDLVVLVVAADDGVMEQTREAISHSRAAGVPILVAVNKMDKETANPERVLRELSELGLQAESWGGDTVVSYVSAKQRQGLDELLELIALQAEIMELKANPDKLARGHVVEAKLDKGRGPVATVLIQEGTLHQGDAFVCGVFAGRVRAMFDDQGRKIKEAGPSTPVEIQGFEGVPEAGEEFVSLSDEKNARRIAEARAIKQREREMARDSHITLETFLARAGEAETLVLNLVLKADVQGSLEAITEALRKQSTDKVRIEIIHGGAGAISESDIMLASASNAIIIGFNVRPTAKVKEVAEHEKVDIRFYDIIYKLTEDIRSAMAGLLAPVTREVYLGQAEVRQPFSLPKIGTIAGSYVQDGKMARNAHARLLRDGVVIYTGKITSLKHVKDDMREVAKGMECGIGLENFNDIKIGDIIEAFDTVEEAATL